MKILMVEPIEPIKLVQLKNYFVEEGFLNFHKKSIIEKSIIISAEQLQENEIRTSIRNAINIKKNNHRVLLRANTGSARDHHNLGMRYELGHDDFPINYIQAKKHYLHAALLNDPDINLEAQESLKRINISIKTGANTPFLKRLNNPQDRYTADYMQLELSKIEEVYGKSSIMEDKVSQPYSLKDTCMNFLALNIGLFKREKLPKELGEEMLQIRNKFI